MVNKYPLPGKKNHLCPTINISKTTGSFLFWPFHKWNYVLLCCSNYHRTLPHLKIYNLLLTKVHGKSSPKACFHSRVFTYSPTHFVMLLTLQHYCKGFWKQAYEILVQKRTVKNSEADFSLSNLLPFVSIMCFPMILMSGIGISSISKPNKRNKSNLVMYQLELILKIPRLNTISIFLFILFW